MVFVGFEVFDFDAVVVCKPVGDLVEELLVKLNGRIKRTDDKVFVEYCPSELEGAI